MTGHANRESQWDILELLIILRIFWISSFISLQYMFSFSLFKKFGNTWPNDNFRISIYILFPPPWMGLRFGTRLQEAWKRKQSEGEKRLLCWTCLVGCGSGESYVACHDPFKPCCLCPTQHCKIGQCMLVCVSVCAPLQMCVQQWFAGFQLK